MCIGAGRLYVVLLEHAELARNPKEREANAPPEVVAKDRARLAVEQARRQPLALGALGAEALRG